MRSKSKTAHLKVDTRATSVRITSEPRVSLTRFGYTPFVKVQVSKTGERRLLFINARTLAVQLEPLRNENNGKFKGLEFSIQKESQDQKAPYVLSKSNNSNQRRSH